MYPVFLLILVASRIRAFLESKQEMLDFSLHNLNVNSSQSVCLNFVGPQMRLVNISYVLKGRKRPSFLVNHQETDSQPER